jgi:putative membrane protein
MWYGNGMSGWGYAVMALSNILFWGVIIYGLVALFRYLGRTSPERTARPAVTPEQILAERYARGEIDDEEYHRRLETLRTTTPPIAKP